MKNTSNLLCICNHPRLEHTIVSIKYFNNRHAAAKHGCSAFPKTIEEMCECKDFKLDNLSYIEMKAKRKKLI